LRLISKRQNSTSQLDSTASTSTASVVNHEPIGCPKTPRFSKDSAACCAYPIAISSTAEKHPEAGTEFAIATSPNAIQVTSPGTPPDRFSPSWVNTA
uniref:Ovule protein n=1 Tax=Echinostoma caproni TaxID=27848 RepID=A0A183BGC7_9TREM